MTDLNLLDKETKRQIAKNIQSISLVNNMTLLAIVLIIVSGVLLGAEKYLDYQTAKIRAIKTQNTEEAQIAKINALLKEVNLIQAGYVKWSQALVTFSALVPEGNKLEKASFDKKNQRLSMRGLSNKRRSEERRVGKECRSRWSPYH